MNGHMQLHAWSDYCSVLQPCYAVDHLHLLLGRQGTCDAIWIHNMCAQSCRGGRAAYVCTYEVKTMGEATTSTHIQLPNVHRTRDLGILPPCCDIIYQPTFNYDSFSFIFLLISKLSTVKMYWLMACEMSCWCIVAARRGWNLAMITSFLYINTVKNYTRMVPVEC